MYASQSGMREQSTVHPSSRFVPVHLVELSFQTGPDDGQNEVLRRRVGLDRFELLGLDESRRRIQRNVADVDGPMSEEDRRDDDKVVVTGPESAGRRGRDELVDAGENDRSTEFTFNL